MEGALSNLRDTHNMSSANVMIKPQAREPHDSSVTFEEYHYYAKRTREEQKTFQAPPTDWRHVVLRKKRVAVPGAGGEGPGTELAEKSFAHRADRMDISDEEWTNASRMFRTASWGACKLSGCQAFPS